MGALSVTLNRRNTAQFRTCFLPEFAAPKESRRNLSANSASLERWARDACAAESDVPVRTYLPPMNGADEPPDPESGSIAPIFATKSQLAYLA